MICQQIVHLAHSLISKGMLFRREVMVKERMSQNVKIYKASMNFVLDLHL